MKYLGAITNDYDLVTKKYVDDAAKVIQTLTSGTAIGSVGGTTLYAPASGSGTITSVKTTAGAHSTINVSSGAANFNVPTAAAHVGAVADCTIGLYNGQGGNPGACKFCTVNYSACDSNNGVLVKITMMAGHGNGTSYNHYQDAIISVGYTGTVSVNIFRYYAASVTYESTTHYYGDIFYTIDTTNKVVTFYDLMGQYSYLNQAPYKKMNGSSKGTVTQFNGTAVHYSSGTKTYANIFWMDGSTKQDTLVSGTNIKTVNNNSLVGNGNVSVGTITGITTSAGTHSTINKTSGSASFNVPTKTSHLTNDSGFTNNTGTITGVTAGTGLSGGGTSGSVTLNHSNSITAGTIGSSSASQGSTVAIPYATYDSNGHITGKGTHTHTITGFLTAETDPVFSASSAAGISPSDISNWNGKADTTGFFKIVEVSFTQATISAHSYASGTSHSVPSASRPSGMTLVGIVGFRSSIYRLYPYTYYVDGAHSFWMGMTNATASSSGEATIRVELLYIKATSA